MSSHFHFRRLGKIALTAVCVLACNSRATWADPVPLEYLVFNAGRPVTGTVGVSSTGGSGPTLFGTTQVISGGIMPFDGSVDLSRPEDVARANQFEVLGGRFTFTTGQFSRISNSGEGFADFLFGDLGTFEVVGSIPALGIGEPTTLARGTLTGGTYNARRDWSFFALGGTAFTVHPSLAGLFQQFPPNPGFDFGASLYAAPGPISVTEPFNLPST